MVATIFSFLKKNLILLFLFISFSAELSAQNAPGKHHSFRAAVHQDSSKNYGRFKSDSTLFTDTNTLTRADYLAALQRVFETQNKVPVMIASFTRLNEIDNALSDDDSVIILIKDRLNGLGNRTLNLQNVQTYQELLTDLQENNQDYNKTLYNYDTTLDNLKRSILYLRKDTVLRHIFRDSVLRFTFLPQFIELREKRTLTDSLVKQSTAGINDLKARVSANSLAIAELLFKLKILSDKATANAFAKDRSYLLESSPEKRSNNNYSALFGKKIDSERKITAYYFKNTRDNRLYLILLLFAFFFWVHFNFYGLKKRNKIHAIDKFNFQYIKPLPFFASFLFILVLAPAFDLNAPAIYSEFIEILTLITLSVYFFKKLPRIVFYCWCVFCLLFLTLPALRLLGLPIYLERWGIFFIDIAALVFGIFALIKLHKKALPYKHLLWAGILYATLNFLSIIANLFGRVILTNELHFTAVYSFAQAIALTIWAKIIVEVILLQIGSSRVRKNYPEDFDFIPIQKGVSKMAAITAVIIWLVYFTDNLNIFDILLSSLSAFLTQIRAIGSFSFTIGGICLFLGIIIIANFLQKYIGYLFGDTGEDFLVENKKERSRLLITRLVLLIVGFLLAVAASGLPVDRITIILGALSVGIGLGLQNIVNNFVSGVILVFDRTLRIGDVVEVSDKKGRVKEIGLRASKLITGDGAEIIIPNGDVLSHNIINWTLSNNHVRLNMSFTVAKPYNTEEISRICNEELMLHKNVLKENAPAIVITSITASFATVKIYFWCNNISQTETTYSQLNEAIYNRFEASGIKVL